MPESLSLLLDQRQQASSPLACHASSADPEWWFPEPGDSLTAARAKRICAICPVQLACRAMALARGERFGIWGGADLEQESARSCPCCGKVAPPRNLYCGDDCRSAARRARQRRYDARRRLRLAGSPA